MDLDVIGILQFNSMLAGDGKGISGKVAEIGGMPVKSAYSAACHNCTGSSYGIKGTVRAADHSAVAVVVFFQDIYHGGVFQKLNIGKLLNFAEQGTGDFFASDILMENNAVCGMSTFSGVGKAAVLVPFETCAVGNQILDYFRRGADHDIHGFLIVFIMTSFHGVLEKAVVIGLLFQHAHTALSQVRIVAGKVGFGYDGNFFFAGKLEGTVKPGAAGACDENICFHSWVPFLII